MGERSAPRPRRGVDRRTFLARGGGVALLAGSGGLATLLSACGDDGGSAVATGATTTAGGGVGPRVVIGNSEGDPSSLDAARVATFALFATVGSAAHDYLLRFMADGSIQPSIATGHEVDGSTVRFELRDDVVFHNGRAMEPRDVKESYERLLARQTASPFAPQLSTLKRIRLDGANAVVFEFDAPNVAFPALSTQIPIIPIETAAEQPRNPVGAGPFTFKQWDKGNFMDFDRFEEYFGAPAPVEGVRFLPRTDASALRAGFLAKQEDVAVGYLWPDKAAMSADGAQAQTQPLNGFQFFVMNTTRRPFDDPRVRRAISLGIDRQAIADTMNGEGSTVESTFIPPSSPFATGLSAEYDPQQAAELLRAAGVEQGTEIEGILVDLPLVRPIAPVWQAQMRAIGINLKPTIMQPADLIDRVITRGDYGISQMGDASPPDPSLFLDRYFKTDGSTNMMKWSNREVDALLDRASTTADEEVRKDAYREVSEIALEQAPVAVWMQTPINYAVQESVGEFAMNPSYFYDLRTTTKA